jgi:hypothetical protein
MRCCWVVWSLSLQVERVFCIVISAAGPSADAENPLNLRHNATQQQDSISTPSTVSRAWHLSTPHVPITYYITSK